MCAGNTPAAVGFSGNVCVFVAPTFPECRRFTLIMLANRSRPQERQAQPAPSGSDPKSPKQHFPDNRTLSVLTRWKYKQNEFVVGSIIVQVYQSSLGLGCRFCFSCRPVAGCSGCARVFSAFVGGPSIYHRSPWADFPLKISQIKKTCFDFCTLQTISK